MGSVETEVYVEENDVLIEMEPRRSEVAVSATSNGEVPANASFSSSSSDGAHVKVCDSGNVAVSKPVKDSEDHGQEETLHAASVVKENGLDHCNKSHTEKRPFESTMPIDQVKHKPNPVENVRSAASADTDGRVTETNTVRSGGNVQQFVPRRMTHSRRDSQSGEIPVQGLPRHSGVHNELEYEYDQGLPGFPVRGRARHQQQRERHAMNHHDHQGPNQDRDPDWQGMEAEGSKGTVYAYDETYSFRFMMLSRYVGQFIGRHGAHIKNIVNSSGVISISVEQDYVIDKTNQVVNVYGDRDTCDAACYEILKFLFLMNTGHHAEECPDGTVQMMLLANDDYCGMLIGRDGRSLRQMREECDTRISFAKLLGDSRYMELYPERVVFVSGLIRNVVLAQSEITTKQYSMRLHETDAWQSYNTRRPNISRTMHDLDNNTICDIIIDNDVAGAVIGRRGANIKTIMTKSQALVSVLPKIGELEVSETRRYVRIAGSHEGVFRASYMVFLYVTRAMPNKPKMDSLVLDSQLFVPALSVGHIIGKRGHRVRSIESKTNVKIYVLNAPQPPPSPSGSYRSRVKITGNFWNTQVAIREVLKVVHNASRCSYPDNNVDNPAVPHVRQRRASLSTARELVFNENPTAQRSQETCDLPPVQSASKPHHDPSLVPTPSSRRNDISIRLQRSRPQVVSCPSTRNASPSVDHRNPGPAAASAIVMNGMELKSQAPEEVGVPGRGGGGGSCEITSSPRTDVQATTAVVSSASCLSLPVNVEGASSPGIEVPIQSSSPLELSDHSVVKDSIAEVDLSVPSILMTSSHVNASAAERHEETGSMVDEKTSCVTSPVKDGKTIEMCNGNMALDKMEEKNEINRSTVSGSVEQEVAAEIIAIAVRDDVHVAETSNGGELTTSIATASGEQTESQVVETAASKQINDKEGCHVDPVGSTVLYVLHQNGSDGPRAVIVAAEHESRQECQKRDVVETADADAERNGEPVQEVATDQECRGLLVSDDVAESECAGKRVDEPTDTVGCADHPAVMPETDVSKKLAPIIEDLESPQRDSHVAESACVIAEMSVCEDHSADVTADCSDKSRSSDSTCERQMPQQSPEAGEKGVDSAREDVVIEEHNACLASSLASKRRADQVHELVEKMTVTGGDGADFEASGLCVSTGEVPRPDGDPVIDSK